MLDDDWEEDQEMDEMWSDDPEDELDCLNCGMCESCIDRSIEHAREMEDIYDESRHSGTD